MKKASPVFETGDAFLLSSGHLQAQLSAAQNVEVQVVDGLTGVVAAVGDDAVAVFQALGLCHLGSHHQTVGNDPGVLSADGAHAGDMRLGDHQDVGGSLGRDVPEGQAQVILVDLGGGDGAGDDLAEQTVFNDKILLTQ